MILHENKDEWGSQRKLGEIDADVKGGIFHGHFICAPSTFALGFTGGGVIILFTD